MEQVVSLIVPFIALAIVSVMIDALTRWLGQLMHRVPLLPDELEWDAAYAVVLVASYIVCWRSNYNLFEFLGLRFQHPQEGWVMTALVVSGGSGLVRSQFDMINSIPSVLGGVTSSVRRFFGGGKTSAEPAAEPASEGPAQEYPKESPKSAPTDTGRYSEDI